MSLTSVAEVADQVQTKWSALFMKELRSNKPLPELVNKSYEGAIGAEGDRVRVSMLRKATGQLRTVGTDADTFDSEQMTWAKVDVAANKRAVASFDVATLAEIQSQLGSPAGQSEMRNALLEGVSAQINNYLWSKVAPSQSALDMLITSKSALSAAELKAYRVLAGQAKWLKDGRWYGLLDPVYHGDLLGETTMVSKDYIDGESPTVAGEIVNKRFGFGLLEDNSRADKKGLFFHPDFMILVMQQRAQFKISDLHPLGKFGYKISVDVIFGAELGPDGDDKHIYVTSASTNDAASSAS